MQLAWRCFVLVYFEMITVPKYHKSMINMAVGINKKNAYHSLISFKLLMLMICCAILIQFKSTTYLILLDKD